ncbi:MAG: exodeoxyribonuclease VII small subunit [Spirochaetales bacterium]|nr:exodeoxyribonuclease VII small subunit [Spirochaetales bacterium]
MKTFEERLVRLEKINEEIQSGDIPLEKAVALFEEGIALSKGLEKELAKIERKVEILINKPDKPDIKPELELFPELDDKENV